MGNHESYLFFIDKATSLAGKNGLVSFVTPDSWIKVPQAQRLRDLVLCITSIRKLTTLPQRVFPKVSANCIIFALEKEGDSEQCEVYIMRPNAQLVSLSTRQYDDAYQINVSRWKASADKQFQIFQNDEISLLVQKLRANSAASEFLDVMQGIVPYSKENHSAAIIQNRGFHSNQRLSDTYGPWIKGRGISRYGAQFDSDEYLNYGPWLHRSRKSKYFDGPRILIQEITGGKPPRICACYCDSLLYHDPGVISCLVIGNLDLRYLLGVLNSKLLSWYHRTSSPKGTRHTFPKF